MVYVDNMNAPYGDMIMCHMIADSTEELLAMVQYYLYGIALLITGQSGQKERQSGQKILPVFFCFVRFKERFNAFCVPIIKAICTMADKIGVKRKWLQYPGTRHEHFDICLSKKKLAIKAGAKEVSMLERGYMMDQPQPLPVDPKEMDLAQLVMHFEENPDWKGSDQITVKVGALKYLIPHYCVADALWGMPDSFYPCDKYEWADHPLYFTTIEMVKEAIAANPDKFSAFILYP